MASLATASTATLASFIPDAFIVAVLIHAVVSILVGLLYGVMLPMLPRYPILLAGIVAPLLWTGLLWSTLNVIDPLLDERIEWRWFVLCQIAFGVPPESSSTDRENPYAAASLIRRSQRRRGRGLVENRRNSST